MKADSVVYYKDGLLVLDSGMSESLFSKSRLSEHLNDKGLLARRAQNIWTFSDFGFEGTVTSDVTHNVLWTASCFEGYTLKDYLENDDDVLKFQAVSSVISFLEAAIKGNMKPEAVGAGGFFVSEDFNQVIILPSFLFSSAVSCRSAEINASYNQCYLHENLTGNKAVRFTQAVIGYKALTGDLPYREVDLVKRHEDHVDYNYKPVSESVYGLDNLLADFIDSCLCVKLPKQNSKSHNVAPAVWEDVEDDFPVEELNKSLGLTAEGTVGPGETLAPRRIPSNITQAEFEAKGESSRKTFGQKLKVKRWFRHNRTVLSIAAGAAVVAAFFVATYNSGASSKPCTRGLTSNQVVSMFYSAINRLDVDGVGYSGKGRQVKHIGETVSNFYVTGKAISMYDTSKCTVSPATWLNWNYEGGYRIFGLTQLEVDGQEEGLFFTGPERKDKSIAYLTEENGKTLSQGDTVQHEVSFYMLYTEDGQTLKVLKRNDIVTLTYLKNQWYITDCVISEKEDAEVNISSFYASYVSAMDTTAGDVLGACDILRKSYYWLSTEREIRDAFEDLKVTMPS